MIGYVLAFISSLFFSLYIIPRKLSNLPAVLFSLLVGIGFFSSSLVLYFLKPVLDFQETIEPALLWSVLAGIFWAIGLVLLVKAIDIIGLARSNQWKNLQGPIGVILSLVILGEYAKTNPVFAVLAGVAIFLSATAFTIANSKDEAHANLKGVYLACLSGIAFGTVTVINKYVTDTVGVYSQQVVWSASILLSLTIYAALQKGLLRQIRTINKQDLYLGLVGGILYLGASYFMLQSYKHIPASIGFTIIQLNAVWTIAIGILIFKEIDAKKHWIRILTGLILALLGILLLTIAKK